MRVIAGVWSLTRQSELTSFRNVSVLRWRGWAQATILSHCQNGGKIKYFWLIAFRSFPDVPYVFSFDSHVKE